MSCGCGNSGCAGGCGGYYGGLTPQDVLNSPSCAGVRPCSPLAGTCGCGNANCGGCTSMCSNTNSASPQPYYLNNPQCQENNCQQIVYNRFATAICTQYAFNMPACGSTATAYFQNVSVLTVGSFLWHQTYGYLEVTAFNPQTGQATLLNNCNEGNASVGSSIPACTCFDVVDPPVSNNDPTNFPFVATDFVAPNNGDCITINVTTTNGLAEGGKIAIGTGFYVLDSIVSPTQIRICNEGEGITPGTTVVAKNDAGAYQYPITSVQTNPCTEDAVAEGVIVGCSAGILVPLTTPVLGDVPVVSDQANSLSQFVTLGLDAQDTLPVAVNTTINAGNTYTSAAINHTVTNTHPYKSMKVMVVISVTFSLAPFGVTDGNVGLDFKIQNQVNGGGYVEMKHNSCNTVITTDGILLYPVVMGLELVCHGIYTIAPSSSSVINWQYILEANNTNTHPAAIQDAQFQATTFGVAV